MIRKVLPLVAILVLGAAWSAAPADDVRGTSRMLCSVNLALSCTEDGDCESGPPWILNIPEFIEVNLAEKVLTTTKSSEERRETPIKLLERFEGAVYIHGSQNGRAFSFVITEETGMITYAVAAEEMVVTGFGACTPRS